MFFFRTISLRRLFLFVAIIIGLGAINLFWLIPGIRNIRISTSRLSLEVADRVRSNVSAYLEDVVNDVRLGAEEIAVEPERSDIVFHRLLKGIPGLRSVALVNRSGDELSRADRFSVVTPRDLKSHSKEAYVYLALEGRANFGEVFVSQSLEPTVELAVPVRLFGTPDKVLVAELNLRDLIRTVTTFRFKGALIYILDNRGFLIVHPDITKLLLHPNFVYRPVAQKVIVDGKIADGLSFDDGYVNERGEKVFAVGVPLALTGWGIFVEQLRSQALAQETQMIIFALTTIAAALLLFAVVIRANVRQSEFAGRLQELLKENDLSAKLLIQRDRELTRTNEAVRELNQELNETTKILIRRDLELTRANDRLRDLDMIKSEFVSVAAHQLRTPLTGVKWSYYSLLDKTTGELTRAKRVIVEEGLRATERMIKLINDLLNVARIEEGKFGFSSKAQSFAAFMQKRCAPFFQLMRDKGIVMTLDMPAGNPLLVEFDEEKLAIAFDNLLENAMKYTLPGGRVTVRALPEGKMLNVEIQDTGIGIDREQLGRIFTKFFRADNAVRLQTSGTGLGLYVSKNIIEGHGGSVDVKSEEGKGTLFTVTLPAAKPL